MVDARKAVALKKEVTYGTDSAPNLTDNAVPTRNFRAKPVESDTIERNLDSSFYGATESAPSNERQTFSFEVELAGSGAAGTAPRFMELFEGCGMAAPVIVAATSATQAFDIPTNPASSLTGHHWMADQRRKAVGVRGTFGIDFTAGRYPFANFNMTGLLPATPFDTDVPGTADFSDWIKPLEVNTANTDFTLDGYAAPLRSLQLNANVGINVRNLVGANYVNRANHTMRGQIVIEAPPILTHDYLATRRTGDVITCDLDHGVAAGAILEVRTPQLQILDINEGEEDDKVMWTLDVLATILAGADDFSIAAK